MEFLPCISQFEVLGPDRYDRKTEHDYLSIDMQHVN